MGVVVAASLFESGHISFAGRSITVEMRRVIDGSMMRRILVNIPSFVSSFLRADLGTDKLSKQLVELDVSGSSVSDLFRTGLMADLKVNAFLKQVKRFLTNHPSSPYLLEAAMWKKRDSYLRYGFTEAEGTEFRRIISEADADLRGLRGDKRKKHVSKAAQDLSSKKNIHRSRQ